jgi:hypothetical protein
MKSPTSLRHLSVCVLLTAALAAPQARAQEPASKKDPGWLLPIPELEAAAQVPTLAQVVGHRWAEEISSHAEIERYIQALAKAAPDRCLLTKYGQSYQGKGLYNLVITSPANLKRLEQIRTDNLALADPRTTTAAKGGEIATAAPVVVWLAYCVHGNEASPSDAALLTAYHLLADRRPQTQALLEKVVVIIDPLQNPDGRDRFVYFHRETRGGFDQDDPLAADRLERWPGGRFNHYLFDMNRDWYLQSQKESRARVAAFLRWKPQIFVDAHEMGPDSTFFFDPSTDPYNPHTLGRQKDWHVKIGRHHAEHFDRYGFAYTTRELFDAFGPQYGSTWPIMHGSIGILWEQAGVRGRVITRRDQTQLYYHDGVRHHYISALATLEAAANNRQPLLLDYYRNAADSVKVGESGPIRGFFLLEGRRPTRAASLAQLLVRNGIEVQRISSPVKTQASDIASQLTREYNIPPGSYWVSLRQPASRLALTLLERHQDMGAAYIKRQEDRVRRGLPDEIYDSTAWSLPLAFDVPCLSVAGAIEVAGEAYGGVPLPGKVVGNGKRPRIGYLLSGDDDGAMPALCDWLKQKLRVQVFSEPTRVNNVNFPRGSLLLRVNDNPESLHDAIATAVQAHGVVAHAVDNAFVEEGASLGGPNVHWVKPPRVLLLTDRPASYSVGHTWYLFDQVWRYPVTRVAGRSLAAVDWSKFDVCILPHGVYAGEDAPSDDVLRRLKDWVQGGGTLIVVGGAAGWAASDKVKLLASKLEVRPSDDDKKDEKKDDKDKTDKRPPLSVPGAFLRVAVDNDHFTTWGMDREAVVYFSGNRIFAPYKGLTGKNLVTFTDKKDLVVSGYCWQQTMPLLPGRACLLHQALGRGHIVAFADDPNYRAFSPSLQRLFFNATFHGPAR